MTAFIFILLVLAVVLFFLQGLGKTNGRDLLPWGLFCWALSELLRAVP